MAMKKCPQCGKKIAEKAQYCIYCASRFDDKSVSISSIDESAEDLVEPINDRLSATQQFNIDDAETVIFSSDDRDANATQVIEDLPDETVSSETTAVKTDAKKSKRFSKNNLWLVLSIVGFALIACVIVLLIVQTFTRRTPAADDSNTTPTTTTCPTRDSQRDAWLQTFVGEWVDEFSVGKGNIEKQGGYVLTITKIDKDLVCFDLHAYSGGGTPKMASVTGFQEYMLDDTLHFEFANDGLGNAGEGHLQFRETGINMEVVVYGLPENDPPHSLAINSVFLRQQLPSSEGLDIRTLNDETTLRAALGAPEKEPEADKDGIKTYVYSGLTARVNAEGKVLTIAVDYTSLDNPSLYCYNVIDGTNTYDTVKAYYGAAEQDYQETPTNIHVLQYPLSETSSVKFTFNWDAHSLIKIEYIV